MEKTNSDTGLKEKLKAAGDADSVVALAKEAGFTISATDLSDATKALMTSNDGADMTDRIMTDDEMEAVSGGCCGGSWSFSCGDKGLMDKLLAWFDSGCCGGSIQLTSEKTVISEGTWQPSSGSGCCGG